MRFWDSSALVPLFVREERSPLVDALVEEDPAMVVWWASPVECGSAAHRLRREGVFPLAEAAQLLTGLAAAIEAADVVVPGDEVCARALGLLAVHPLRAADALQLAAALLWCRGRTAGRDFVCMDGRLRTAALLEGFTVLPAAASSSSREETPRLTT